MVCEGEGVWFVRAWYATVKVYPYMGQDDTEPRPGPCIYSAPHIHHTIEQLRLTSPAVKQPKRPPL